MKLSLICYCYLAISLLRNQSITRKFLRWIMLSTPLLTPLITALAATPYIIAIIRIISKFEALREKFYEERI